MSDGPTAGRRVGGRYRLEREIGRGPSAVTWEAFDERLDRAVALRIFAPSADRRVLTRRAGQAASLTHPRAVRVFDTGFDEGRFFTVSELLPASAASAAVPVRPRELVRTAIDVADALQHAHDRGVVHGRLRESNVLLSNSGAKVGDFAFNAPSDANAAGDLRDLGALLRRLSGSGTGPVRDDPSGFAAVVEGLQSGTYDSAGAAAAALRALDIAPEPQRSSRRWWIPGVAIVLAGFAVFGLTRLGERSPHMRFAPGGRIDGTPVAVERIEDYDPLGDGREGRATVARIADGNPTTFWSTERYSGSARFSGLKPGVGVLFDLGQPAEVGRAQFLFPTAGCSFQLLYTDDRDKDVAEWAEAASVASSPPSAPIIFEGAEARWWLLWITGLVRGVPGAGGSYSCAVSDARLFAP